MEIKKLANPVQGFKDITQEATGQLQEQATGIASAIQEQLNAVLDEYQNVLPVAESLGLKVGSFQVQMGVLPEVRTTLSGMLERIDPEVVEKLIGENQTNKLLVLILNGLLVTKNLQQRLNITNLKGIVVDVKLGIPPSVSVHLAS